jgi:hypothetical protein
MPDPLLISQALYVLSKDFFNKKMLWTPSEEPVSVLTLAVITGVVGIALASIFKLDTTAGFIVGFLVGFLIFGLRLFLLDWQTEKTKVQTVNSLARGDQSITLPCPICGTVITIKITHVSNDSVSQEENKHGGE